MVNRQKFRWSRFRWTNNSKQPWIGMHTHLQSFVVLQICKRRNCASATPSWETFLVRNTTESKQLKVCFHKSIQPSLSSLVWTVKSAELHCRAFLQGKCRDGENCSWKPRSQVSESTPCSTICTCCWWMLKTSDTMCKYFKYTWCQIMRHYETIGDHCIRTLPRFAHGDSDLRVTAGIYKTQMCNFYERGHCKKVCESAHSV